VSFAFWKKEVKRTLRSILFIGSKGVEFRKATTKKEVLDALIGEF